MNTATTWDKANRLGGLRRFAVAITILNILGHTVLGFEQSLAQPIAALAAAYGMEILLEFVDAKINRRAPCYRGGFCNLVDFLLSAHITGLACSMLLYANDRIWPVVFGTVMALGSKAIFRITIGSSSRHFLNPSNFGITVTLLVFPWVGIAPPYHFTENLDRIGDWLLPGLIVASGSFLNWRFTKRLPLIAGWVGGFVLQAIIRSLVFGTPATPAFVMMTGLAFVLYTFYMVTDPATTPSDRSAQVAFGAAVAFVYGLLVAVHAVFGLFFALSIVCTARGISIYVMTFYKAATQVRVAEIAPVKAPEKALARAAGAEAGRHR